MHLRSLKLGYIISKNMPFCIICLLEFENVCEFYNILIKVHGKMFQREW